MLRPLQDKINLTVFMYSLFVKIMKKNNRYFWKTIHK